MKNSYKLVYTRNAVKDVKEAIKWYNLRKKELGKKFKSDVSVVIKMIEENPFFASVKYANIRTASCAFFPYAVHYEIEEKNKLIRIISVFHFSRKPKWTE